MDVLNEFGGNMPQDRLDDIKAAWMARHGASAEEWDVFQPQTKMLYNEKVTVSRLGLDSYAEEVSTMEFPFCPDWTEMGHRYRSKVYLYRSELADAIESGDQILASKYREEVSFWTRMSEDCFNQAINIRRKL